MNANIMIANALLSVARQAQLVNNPYETTVPPSMRGNVIPYPVLNDMGVGGFLTIIHVLCGTTLSRAQSEMVKNTALCSSTHVHGRIAVSNVGVLSQQVSWVEATLEFPPRDVQTNILSKLLLTRIHDLSGYTIEMRLNKGGQIVDTEILLEDRFGRHPFADKKTESILHMNEANILTHLNRADLLSDTVKKPVDEVLDVRTYLLDL